VQISNIKQVPPTPGTPQPAASPNASPNPKAPLSTGSFLISGVANSFNDVNDFLLVLQKSSFLKASETKLQASELKEAGRISPLRLPNVGQVAVNDKDLPPLPRQVTFTIQTAQSDAPASELLRELNRVGAVGQVTRIENLQNKGILPKP